MSVTQLAALPDGPQGRVPEVRNAWRFLVGAHKSVNGLLDSLAIIRQKQRDDGRDPRGRLSGDQIDVLRSAIVFTSSGLDASMSRLVADAFPPLLELGGGVEQRFIAYLGDELNQKSASSQFKGAVASKDPRDALIKMYVLAKTKSSFQGSGDLKTRVRDLLALPNAALPDGRFAALDQFFIARNEIVHWMDYEHHEGRSTARTARSLLATVADCDRVFLLCADLILTTGQSLRGAIP